MKSLLIFSLSIFALHVHAVDNCDITKIQSQKTEMSTTKDAEMLKRTMEFSYEKETAKFFAQLNSAMSGMYYKGTKYEPLMTVLYSSYKSPQVAQKAAAHLNNRWVKGRTGPQYDVAINGNDVVWFANNSLNAPCFKKLVAVEKIKIFKK
jgi:hypothetical protein